MIQLALANHPRSDDFTSENAASVHRIVVQPLSIPSMVAEAAECDGGLQLISYQVDFSVQVTPIAWSDTLRSLEEARIRPLFQIREMLQLLVDLLRPDVRARPMLK